MTYIKQWQFALKLEGFYIGRVDGVFGPRTLDASRRAARLPRQESPVIIDRIGDTQLILNECAAGGLSVQQCAYVLATTFWETNHTMKPVVEAYWLSEDWRRKNLWYYPWHGRGYVQLTHKANYERAGEAIGVDLIADPELAMKPEHAVGILVDGMKEGWFTGKKLSDYINGNVDYIGARRIVNGTDKAAAIAEIARDYEKDLKEERYSA